MSSSLLELKTWFFKTKDVDKLIVGLILTLGVTKFVESLNIGIFSPLVDAIVPGDKDSVQRLDLYFTKVEFKIQAVITGFVQLILFTIIAFGVRMVSEKIE